MPAGCWLDQLGKITGDLADISLDRKQQLISLGGAHQAALIDPQKGRYAFFVEPINPDDVLYLFGAGHISRHVASLSGMVGFTVVVIDDREEFANRYRFPQAKEIVVNPSYPHLKKSISIPHLTS